MTTDHGPLHTEPTNVQVPGETFELEGPEACFERDCEEYYDEDGHELPDVATCSHIYEVAAQSPAEPRQPREDGTDPGTDRALLVEVIRYLADGGSSGTSTIQRKFHLWFAKASHLLDLAESWGVVGPGHGSMARKVLLSGLEFQDVIERIEHPSKEDA